MSNNLYGPVPIHAQDGDTLVYSWRFPASTPKIDNPIGQSLVVTWQEDGKIQFRGCKDYEEVYKVYSENFVKPYVKVVKSVVFTPVEIETLARAEKVEKAEKAQRELDEKEYRRLQEKLGY